MNLLIPFVCRAQNSLPLSEDELRIILEQLKNYEIDLKEYLACKDRLLKEQILDTAEDLHQQQLLELEKERTILAKREIELTIKERDMEKEKASFYETAYKQLTKKPPLWCRVVRSIPVVGWFTNCH